MAKKKKRKPIGSTWVRRKRKIRGRNRYVYVRKIKGKYQMKMHRPEVHGIALAQKVFGAEPEKRKKADKSRAHKTIIKPTDKNIKRYKKEIGSADIKSVDTKR